MHDAAKDKDCGTWQLDEQILEPLRNEFENDQLYLLIWLIYCRKDAFHQALRNRFGGRRKDSRARKVVPRSS